MARRKTERKRLLVSMPPAMYERLREVADRRGVTMTEVCRRALELFFHEDDEEKIRIHAMKHHPPKYSPEQWARMAIAVKRLETFMDTPDPEDEEDEDVTEDPEEPD